MLLVTFLTLYHFALLTTAKSKAPNAFPNSRVLLVSHYCATQEGPARSHRHRRPGRQTDRIQQVPQRREAGAPRKLSAEPAVVPRCILPGRGLLILRFSTQTGVYLKKGLERFPLSLINAQIYMDFPREVSAKSLPKHSWTSARKGSGPPGGWCPDKAPGEPARPLPAPGLSAQAGPH